MATSYKFTGYAFGKFVKEDQWAVALEQTHERKRRVAYLLQQWFLRHLQLLPVQCWQEKVWWLPTPQRLQI